MAKAVTWSQTKGHGIVIKMMDLKALNCRYMVKTVSLHLYWLGTNYNTNVRKFKQDTSTIFRLLFLSLYSCRNW